MEISAKKDVGRRMKHFLPATQQWFSACVGTPTPAQAEGWPAIASGQDALIAAPTGSGKTLAAFLHFLDDFQRQLALNCLRDELTLLYISPLKALGNDIRENLTRPLNALGLNEKIRVAVRTGDTEASERRAILRRPPHILITTPESLYLLLTSRSGRQMLKSVRAVIVDEIHALLSSKRGTHLFLSLARLDALTQRHVQRVGLSATVRPLELAALHLCGGHECALIAPPSPKQAEIIVDSPLPDMRDLPEHSIWPALAERVMEALTRARTVLVFADGRATCERLAQSVNERAGEILARTHHGCVSKEQRLEAEKMLKSGQLRVMVATSSLELGIDVGEIDEVIQIGCPFSVSSLVQRLGRAGHRPGRVSRLRVFPRTAAEGLNCALTVAAAREGRIENAQPPEMCLDVLSQHLVSMAVDEEWEIAAAVSVLRGAYAYRALTEDTVSRLLAMLAGDYEHACDRPTRARLIYDRLHARFWGDDYTRLLALSSGGTIPDRGWFAVTLADGTRLGELDEEYVFEARLGDKFLLGAFAWRITDILHDRVIVAPDTPAGAASPFWKGDRLMRACETGRFFGQQLNQLDRAARLGSASLQQALTRLGMTASAAVNTARVIQAQMAALGALATDQTIVCEHFSDETGQPQLMIHSPWGGRVNRALSLLIMAALGPAGADVRVYDDDDGLLLMQLGQADFPPDLLRALDPASAASRVRALLPASAMFSLAFRYNAARALLMGTRGARRQPLWIQRLRGAETLKYALADPEHPMLTETLNECSRALLDLPALTSVLTDIACGRIRLLNVQSSSPSPLSLNLRRQAEADLMYVSPLPAAAGGAAPAEPTLAPDPAALAGNYAPGVAIDSAERAHELLLIIGDAPAEEINAPISCLEELEGAGRAVYIDPGLWIAAENQAAYQAALEREDDQTLAPIVRRLTRYAGAQNAESVAFRYAISPLRAQRVLQSLADAGALIPENGAFFHAEAYRAAQKRTISLRRAAVRTASGPAFAALLGTLLRVPGSPARQTAAALAALTGEPLSPEAIEGYLLPARVGGYRPALLDAALAGGEAAYRLLPLPERATPSEDQRRDPPSSLSVLPTREKTAREKARGPMPPGKNQARFAVSFLLPEDEGEAFPAADALSPAQARVYRALVTRGASFARTLAPYAGENGICAVLCELLARGLVRADHFAPVRCLMKPGASSLKAGLRSRVQALDAGRWEAVRAPCPLGEEETLERLFDRRLIVCRETAPGDWARLLPLLRRREYAGQVRRGYFVEGLSGAQFVRERDFARLTLALSAPGNDMLCLCAADPLQAWGLYLKHWPGREFTRHSSTAVVLRGGLPVAVWERQGEELRLLDNDDPLDAVRAFAAAFTGGEIFPAAPRVTLKRYPSRAVPALEALGFRREMLDFVLSRRP